MYLKIRTLIWIYIHVIKAPQNKKSMSYMFIFVKCEKYFDFLRCLIIFFFKNTRPKSL